MAHQGSDRGRRSHGEGAQNVTRIVGFRIPAPPALAPAAPNRARQTSDPAETVNAVLPAGERKAMASGTAAPTANMAAEVSAA